MEKLETTKSAELSELFIKIPKHQSTPKEMTCCPSRRSLQTLQASPNGGGLNGGKNTHSLKRLPGLDQRGAVKPTSVDQNDRQKWTEVDQQSETTKGTLPTEHTDVEIVVKPGRAVSSSLHVYHDPDPVGSTHTGDTLEESAHSDSAFFDQQAFDLMANEKVPEDYWKDLAEERRRALEETLAENRELSQEVATLKRENSRLLDIAQEASQLKELLEGALTDDEDSAVYTGNQSLEASQTDEV